MLVGPPDSVKLCLMVSPLSLRPYSGWLGSPMEGRGPEKGQMGPEKGQMGPEKGRMGRSQPAGLSTPAPPTGAS